MENVSVIIPTYNRAQLLRRAVESVRAATVGGDEIVIVDDGSTDDTPSIVAMLGDAVRYIRVANRGAGAARNVGVAAAAHDLIAFADSDDEWLPGRLLQQRSLMSAQHGLVYSFTNFGQLFDDGRVEPGWLRFWHGDRRPWSEILGAGRWCSELTTLAEGVPDVRVHVGNMYRLELHANYINVNTLLVRRSSVGDALHFGEGLPTFEDWECFARITRIGDGAYLDIDTALQRAHDGPRLTQAGALTRATTRIGIIERTWATDAAFMKEHGEEVADVLQGLRRIQARALIRFGRKDEARAVVGTLKGAFLERVALAIPTWALVTGFRGALLAARPLRRIRDS